MPRFSGRSKRTRTFFPGKPAEREGASVYQDLSAGDGCGQPWDRTFRGASLQPDLSPRLITNLLFIPWVGFLIVPLTLSASLLSFLFTPLATALISVDEFITLVLLKTVSFFASFPFASLTVSTPTVFEILVFSALLLTAVHLRKGKRMRYLFIGLAVLLTLDVVYWNVKGSLEKRLR